jgi:hypothetical protein
LREGEIVSIPEEAYYLINNFEQFETFLFRSDDLKFANMFEYFAKTLDDDGIRIIFGKIPRRMTKYIQSGKMSDSALSRVQALFNND